MDAGFADDGHEVGIAEPARENVEMEVADDAGACGAAEVHAEIHAVGLVICLEGFFDALREVHHFGEGVGIAEVEFGDVRVRDDHDVAGGVGEAIEDDEDFRAAIGDERFVIVVARDGVAEDAVGLLAGCRLAPCTGSARESRDSPSTGVLKEKLRGQNNAKRVWRVARASGGRYVRRVADNSREVKT